MPCLAQAPGLTDPSEWADVSWTGRAGQGGVRPLYGQGIVYVYTQVYPD